MMIYKCLNSSCRRLFRSHGTAKCVFCEGEVDHADEHEIKQFDKGINACRTLTDALNVMSGEKDFQDGFVDELARTHRTLQQNIGGLLKAVIAHFASLNKEGWYDLRNEAIVKLCVKLHEISKDEHLPFI